MKNLTIVKELYQFSELSRSAKQNAISHFSDVNVDYRWWEFTYEDAGNVNFKIQSFDLDRNKHVKGYFMYNAIDTAKGIIDTHGKKCETYKSAVQYMKDYKAIEAKYTKKQREKEYNFDNEIEELNEKFLKTMCNDYASILQSEYEYLTSEKAIIETIKANGYEFDKQGNF